MALGEAERPTRKSRGENDLKAANHGNSKRDLVERTELGDCLDNAVVFFDLEDKMHVPKWTKYLILVGAVQFFLSSQFHDYGGVW
jgi:hypothetical protein